jgi:hypothetical protein
VPQGSGRGLTRGFYVEEILVERPSREVIFAMFIAVEKGGGEGSSGAGGIDMERFSQGTGY